MQPLLLWQTSFWAVLHSCHLSDMEGNARNLVKYLALCLIMLALLPVQARSSRRLRLKALAREAERALNPFPQDAELQPVFFKARPTSTQPPQPSGTGQETSSGHSGAAQEDVQGVSPQLAPFPPSTQSKSFPSHVPRTGKHATTDARPATLHVVPEGLHDSPLGIAGLTEVGPPCPTQPLPLNSVARVAIQQGSHEGNKGQHRAPPPPPPHEKQAWFVRGSWDACPCAQGAEVKRSVARSPR
jgi:hypothetical protein